jgi:uncharacterized protein YcfJ
MSKRNLNASTIARAALVGTLAAAAGTALATEYGTVVSATPIQVQVPVPQTQCADRQEWIQPAPSGGGALLGALIGGVVGNSIGAGAGRVGATGIGAVAGAAVGDQIEANANPPTAATVRRCDTVDGYQTRVIGYDVVYDYRGQRYTTRMAQPPGDRIALNVSVTPEAEVAPAPPPVTVVESPPPVYGYGGYVGYGGPRVVVAPQLVFGVRWHHGHWR